MSDLMAMFEELDGDGSQAIRLLPPFRYPGSKSRVIDKIIPHIPPGKVYVEPFGGSASILLSKSPSKLEVFNDIDEGIVNFYRCLRDPESLDTLCELLELTIHSRSQWEESKEQFKTAGDPILRAFHWYYKTMYSFGSLGRNFGRAINHIGRLARVQERIPLLPEIHERIKRVQFENRDWSEILDDFDSPDTVFYIDPPYVECDTSVYKSILSHAQHQDLISHIFSLQGQAVVSGYGNPLYDNQAWDETHDFEIFVSVAAVNTADGSNKDNTRSERDNTSERLWVRY